MSKRNKLNKKKKTAFGYDEEIKMEPPPTKRRSSKRSRRHQENNVLRDFRNGSLDITDIDDYFNNY